MKFSCSYFVQFNIKTCTVQLPRIRIFSSKIKSYIEEERWEVSFGQVILFQKFVGFPFEFDFLSEEKSNFMDLLLLCAMCWLFQLKINELFLQRAMLWLTLVSLIPWYLLPLFFAKLDSYALFGCIRWVWYAIISKMK